jgi:hypothetical protein
MSDKYLIYILADLNNETLFIPKMVKDNSWNLASQEAAMYFEYKNRYPSFSEVII